MHANVGKNDARIRAGVAILFLIFAVLLHEQVLASLGALLVALLLGGTALTHNCPLYAVLHLTTAPDRSPAPRT